MFDEITGEKKVSIKRKIHYTIFNVIYIYIYIYIYISSKEMDTATRFQILDETDCISHSTNTLGKGMNPIILPPAMGK